MTTQPAGQPCGCPIFTTHTAHGNPWCQCGHQYSSHTSPGAACTMTASPISDELAQEATIGWYEATAGVSWEQAGKYERAAMLARTRVTLEAAYPAIRQQVAEDWWSRRVQCTCEMRAA